MVEAFEVYQHGISLGYSGTAQPLRIIYVASHV